MSSKPLARAVKVTLEDGEEYIGIEIPQEVIESMGFAHGEILELDVDTKTGSLKLSKTGTIYNGN